MGGANRGMLATRVRIAKAGATIFLYGTSATAAAEKAKQADGFVDSIGVCIHYNYKDQGTACKQAVAHEEADGAEGTRGHGVSRPGDTRALPLKAEGRSTNV